LFLLGAFIIASFGSTACSTQAPTIAHVHIGHAITGHASTPEQVGFFQLAEEQAVAAVAVVDEFDSSASSREALDRQLEALWAIMKFGDEFSFNRVLQEASNHMVYAANSEDASANVRAGAKEFEAAIQGMLVRTDLIELYINETKNSSSAEETMQYADEVATLVRTNLNGEDIDSNGQIGDTPEEYGIRQLRRDIDTMIAAENPPYRTVDRWFLFNLIRMPSGDWIFRRNKSGTSTGY
jgi:hypothetical protein